MKAWQIVGIIEADGWELVRTRGSHRQYRHPGVYVAHAPSPTAA